VRRVLDMERATLAGLEEVLGGGAGAGDDDADVRAAEEAEAWAEQQAALAADVATRVAALGAAADAADAEADPVKKVEGLCRCRGEMRALRLQAKNIADVGEKLNVVIDFVGDVSDQLGKMDGKLDALQSTVSAMADDLRRLVGRPVLEEFREHVDALLRRSRRLRDGVYIPIDGVRGGDDGKFVVNNAPRVPSDPDGAKVNPSFDLRGAVDADFLRRDDKQVLLLAGPAGSGKSTFVNELRLLVVTEYAARRKAATARDDFGGVDVVLVYINLPTVTVNPLADLVHEALGHQQRPVAATIFERFGVGNR
jgi:hypothetical protein